MKLKEALKKFWYFLWKDDSLKGWLISIIILFVFIKLIFFPLLGLVTGTQLPLVIVESCSMYHSELPYFSSFDNWWQTKEAKYSKFEIQEQEFKSFSMKNGFNKGDILFVTKANPEKLKVGDVIIFQSTQKNPIIHRIIKIENNNGEYTFATIGDNNNGQLSFEKNIDQNQLVGKANFLLAPYLGWGKLIFYDWRNPLSQRGGCHPN